MSLALGGCAQSGARLPRAKSCSSPHHAHPVLVRRLLNPPVDWSAAWSLQRSQGGRPHHAVSSDCCSESWSKIRRRGIASRGGEHRPALADLVTLFVLADARVQ